MAKLPGIGRRMVFVIAENELPLTLGDIMDRLGLRTGTAAGERLREVRQACGYDIESKPEVWTDSDGVKQKKHTYVMPSIQKLAILTSDEYREWKKSRTRSSS